MRNDKWIHDIQAGELINFRNACSVWIYKNYEETEDYSAQHTLAIAYYGKTGTTYLHYESSEHLHNAFEHYKDLLGCTVIDISKKPLKL